MKTQNTPFNNVLFFISFVCVAGLALASSFLANLIPYHLISAGVFAMLLGMALNPLLCRMGLMGRKTGFENGIQFVSKRILKAGIVLMGFTLSFSQVLLVGKFSLIVMTFTLIAAFGFGNLFGRLFKMNWKLSNLISAGTGICGGSAIAAIAPVIDADDSDIAYAISATFIFDIIMVIVFPLMGRFFGMSDMGYGLWAGTAVNDTSSVVAAGYAFSEAAGNFATIVKLTRTLSIVPIVLLFGYINERMNRRSAAATEITLQSADQPKAAAVIAAPKSTVRSSVTKIFPWFILAFLGLVALRSITEVLSPQLISTEVIGSIAAGISTLSKFAFIMALGAIGLKTSFGKIAKSGPKPMLHGFIISLLVVVVSFVVQAFLGQM